MPRGSTARLSSEVISGAIGSKVLNCSTAKPSWTPSSTWNSTPSRAGLVKRPEQWKWGSARWRLYGKEHDLIPLEELFSPEPGTDLYSSYRALLYYRGAVPTRENQAAIPRWILQQEQRRGFTRVGAFRRRLRFLTDGLAVGPADKVAKLLETYRKQGRYRRRRHPIPQLDGALYSLREQRSNAFAS